MLDGLDVRREAESRPNCTIITIIWSSANYGSADHPLQAAYNYDTAVLVKEQECAVVMVNEKLHHVLHHHFVVGFEMTRKSRNDLKNCQKVLSSLPHLHSY